MKTNTVFLEKNPSRNLETNQRSNTKTVLLERVEGFALLVASVILYAQSGSSWWLFALLLLAPDIAMLGYLRGPRVGAIAYNLMHTITFPLTLGLIGLGLANTLLMALGLIWLAHIGMDRAVGYGFKLETGFADTTLGRIGT